MIFDLKIGCTVTPRQLSSVFQYSFMKWKLGVGYISNSRLYEVEKIESYSIRFNSRDDAQELTEQLLYHLQNIYGLDTDYWQDDLESMLDDAFDY